MEMRSGARGRPRTLACTSVQVTVMLRRLARIGDRERAAQLSDQESRLIDLRGDQDVDPVELRAAVAGARSSARAPGQRTSIRNGKPPSDCWLQL